MSFALLICRLLGKKVYLLAVGYYSSTTRLGRVAAWMAGKAAHHIVARDQETYDNFRRITRRVSLGNDLAWHIGQLDLDSYKTDVDRLEKLLPVQGKTLFVTLRRFRGHSQQQFTTIVHECITRYANTPIIVGLMEPEWVDPQSYGLLKAWQRRYPNVTVTDFSFNPIALFLFFRRHHKQLIFMGPQFHGILSAFLADVPYLPVVYDNKVASLLDRIAPDKPQFALHDLLANDAHYFITQHLRKTT